MHIILERPAGGGWYADRTRLGPRADRHVLPDLASDIGHLIDLGALARQQAYEGLHISASDSPAEDKISHDDASIEACMNTHI